MKTAIEVIIASLSEMRADLIPQWALVAVTLLLVLFTVRAMREQTTAMARSLSGEMLLRKIDRWDSAAMQAARKRLAGSLLTLELEDIPERQTEPVMNFFEDLGTIVRSGYVDVAAVWQAFSEYVDHYWLAFGEKYAAISRQETGDQSYYSEFEFLVRRLRDYHPKRQRPFWKRLRRQDVRTPTPDEVRDFLKSEERME
jgi:hypothetical protein